MIAAIFLAASILGTPPERIAEIRVHGNATVEDERVIQLAGVTIGETLRSDSIDAITQRLRESGCFDEVDVRKRYRTLQMDEVSLVLLVHEVAGVTRDGRPPSGLRQWRNRVLWLPILAFEDGYGWTYGARASFVDTLGTGERLSIPASWGGERRLAIDMDRTFTRGPLTRVAGSFGLAQHENPYFHLDDRRLTARARVERRLLSHLALGAGAFQEDVVFGGLRRPQWSAGADLMLDTRRDSSYPVNAIVAGLAWDRLHAGNTIDRYRYSLRGYRHVYRQAMLAARAQLDTASAPLPAHEQWLLGGTSVRGLPPDAAAGDKRFTWNTELRVPISSPMRMARLGVNVFLDGGTVAPHAVPLKDVAMERSAGAGLFARLPLVMLNLDVARSLNGRGTRVHFATGFAF